MTAPYTPLVDTLPATRLTLASDAYTAGITTAYKLLKRHFNQMLRKNQSLGRSQKSLKQKLEEASLDNTKIRLELQRQQTTYNRLVGEIGRISTQKSELYGKLENEKFQRDLAELILDSYRDEIEEHKKRLSEKESYIETCEQSVAAACSEISALGAQVSYLKQRVAVGEEDICKLSCKLECIIGERRRQEVINAKLEKERSDAMDGCRYYQSQIGRLKTTYDELEARVNALSVEGEVKKMYRGKQRRRHRI
ncbi:hypothetical protein AK830_g5498 [Neonectria ditissima]|uniref:Uncharacterized protein n=1 Tax=Neonectria ditissima TaxID=78410 RepID=A0A0P7BKS3_9HYPO|nr:hypothetical protein AK830_g5498 [Neonectria ditissima]